MDKQIKILLVDDDEDIRNILSLLLQKRGFITEKAKNGIEGLEKISALKPDIIILDTIMPQMGGIQTCYKLKTSPLTQDIPIIFLSAYKEAANFIGELPGATIEFMDKPCSFESLITRIQTLTHN
ncbi:MAG: response regulator [Candidatus Omnitrophica bacterium]|nr:response regulator [Candidatus Omnitrophota bacterium]